MDRGRRHCVAGEDEHERSRTLKVFKGDLYAAAKVFHQTAGDYKSSMPNAGFAPCHRR